MLITAVKRQPSNLHIEKTENLKENKFNFETIIYLKSRAERLAAKRYTQFPLSPRCWTDFQS
jgi:hypothetical protein